MALAIHKRNEAQRIEPETQTGSSSRFLTAHCLPKRLVLSETRNRVHRGQGWSWETRTLFHIPSLSEAALLPRVRTAIILSFLEGRVPQSGLKSGAVGRRLWKRKLSLLPPTPT